MKPEQYWWWDKTVLTNWETASHYIPLRHDIYKHHDQRKLTVNMPATLYVKQTMAARCCHAVFHLKVPLFACEAGNLHKRRVMVIGTWALLTPQTSSLSWRTYAQVSSIAILKNILVKTMPRWR
jgi:hypothetical protein